MHLLREIAKNKSLLVLLNENIYTEQITEIVKALKKTRARICYVCLNKMYKDAIRDLREAGVNTGNFFFIDVLTSHYKKTKPTKNCIFLSAPVNIDILQTAITRILKKGYNTVIVDAISSLLIYQEASTIVRFTHNILTEEKKAKKIFIMLKAYPTIGNQQALLEDMNMFTDKRIDFGDTIHKNITFQ